VSEIYGSSRDHGGTSSDSGGPERLPDTRGQADLDPHYYDGDIQVALARDTTPTRQQAWRDAADDADAPDAQDDGDGDPWSQDPDIENCKSLDQDSGRFPAWAELADEHPAQADDDDADPGDDSWYSDPGTVARIAEMDELPSPGESRAATWGDHPVFYDEADLDDQDELAPDQVQAPTLTPLGTDSAARGEYPYPSPDGASDAEGTADQGARTNEVLWRRVTELEATNAELKAENTQLGKGMAELQSENAGLGKTLTEVKAENTDLRHDVTDLKARMERVEQNKADEPAASIKGSELTRTRRAEEKGEQPADRRVWTSNEAIGFATMAGGGIVTSVADYWRYLPATYAGITASVLGVGAAAVALIRKHKEVRNAAHRPEH